MSPELETLDQLLTGDIVTASVGKAKARGLRSQTRCFHSKTHSAEAIGERWQEGICKSSFASAVRPSKDIDRRLRRFIHELARSGIEQVDFSRDPIVPKPVSG